MARRADVDEIDTRNTYLVQRLIAPFEATSKGDWQEKVQRVFGEGGGGLGLSDEARALFRNVCSFDYMGSAEFEFGAIPKTLNRIYEQQDLTTFEFTLEARHIKPGWWRERSIREARAKELADAKKAGKRAPRAKKPKFPEITDRVFYVLGPAGVKNYAGQLIQNIASGTQRLKQGARFEWVLDPSPSDDLVDVAPGGWLELDHGFFFFVDKTMFTRVCELFKFPLERGHAQAAG